METRPQKRKIFVSYVPVVHKGYVQAMRQEGFIQVNIINNQIVDELIKNGLPYLERDMRMLTPYEASAALAALLPKVSVGVVDENNLSGLKNNPDNEIYLTNDEIGRKLGDSYFKNSVAKIRYIKTFLKWDKLISRQELVVSPDRVISESEIDREFIQQASVESEKSSDWWRHVGCLLVTADGAQIKSYNHHLPHEHIQYVEGDVRSNFNAGERNDLGTAIHAEASAIAKAARRKDISLDGAIAYVTTFPCQACARLICEVGIKKVIYRDGYSIQDAERIFKDAGIEIVLVK